MDLLGGGQGQRATVVDLRRFLLHATEMCDVALRFPTGRTEAHRLGAESIDESVVQGDEVVVERVMTMVVGVRRVGQREASHPPRPDLPERPMPDQDRPGAPELADGERGAATRGGSDTHRNARGGAAEADAHGVAQGSPGGAVPGEPGIGAAAGHVGDQDLGGDADMGGAAGDEDPLRTQTADGEGAE